MRKLKIKNLLAEMQTLGYEGNPDLIIEGIALDSRQVKPGGLYVAIPGTRVNGEEFIPQALKNGARVVISENRPSVELLSVMEGWIQVQDARKAAAEAAASFYDHPDRNVRLIAVTGTNGKTSTVTLLHQLFRDLGYKAGAFTTIANRIKDRRLTSRLTTPDPVSLYRDLSMMAVEGCDYVFMEASSHALDQDRMWGLKVDVAVFTNLTHDHLDYHGSFPEYLKAKKKLFDNLDDDAVALVNQDDKNGMVMVQNTRARVKTYGLQMPADYHGKVLEMDVNFMKMEINHQAFISRVTGKFNAYNLLAVYGVADSLGIERDELVRALSGLTEVKGRFQRVVPDPAGPIGIVDYAHTPDAVEKLGASASDLVKEGAQLIMALGSGGDRDRTKRPKMARAAVGYADIVILTSDNPRSEDPGEIIEEMWEGLLPHQRAKTFKVTDRREAIRMAVALAQAGDLIVVAGKGHEDYQEIKGERIHFDDVEELELALKEKMKK